MAPQLVREPDRNSRKALGGAVVPSAERLSIATRVGWKASISATIVTSRSSVLIRSANRDTIISRPLRAPAARSMPHEAALRASRSAVSSNENNSARFATATAAFTNVVATSVLPLPVAPLTRISESRKLPPPSIVSRSGLPSETRSLEAGVSSAYADSGSTLTPLTGSIANG